MPADMLAELAQSYDAARAFLQMAADVIRHHHERYDGGGYPDRLAGSAIPLAARIVALADVYDALRSRRSWKPPIRGRHPQSTRASYTPSCLSNFAIGCGPIRSPRSRQSALLLRAI